MCFLNFENIFLRIIFLKYISMSKENKSKEVGRRKKFEITKNKRE